MAGLKILALPTVVRIHFREFFIVKTRAGINPALVLSKSFESKDENHHKA